MAVITPSQHIQDQKGRMIGYLWESVTESDTCLPVRIDKDDVTISIDGTVGGSSTTMKVSSKESGLNEWTAKDLISGSAVALTTANTAAVIAEVGIWYTPTTTGGTGQSINIAVVAK